MKQVSRSDRAILNSGKTANKEHKLVESCFLGCIIIIIFYAQIIDFSLSILGYKNCKIEREV